MTVRTVLVLGDDGRPEELQAGDTVSIVSETGVLNVTADAAMIAGQAVYSTTSAHVGKAKADAAGTTYLAGLAQTAIGNGAVGPVQFNGIVTLTTAEWDAVAGTTGGLSPNADYYLSPSTAGLLTETCPTTTGQFVMIAGRAVSTTSLALRQEGPYQRA